MKKNASNIRRYLLFITFIKLTLAHGEDKKNGLSLMLYCFAKSRKLFSCENVDFVMLWGIYRNLILQSAKLSRIASKSNRLDLKAKNVHFEANEINSNCIRLNQQSKASPNNISNILKSLGINSLTTKKYSRSVFWVNDVFLQFELSTKNN